MDFGISGKTAFVAASSEGLGLAIAEALAEEGVALMLCARGEDRVQAIARRLTSQYGISASAISGDLDSAEFIQNAREYCRDILGDVDILVTNNGGPPTGTFNELDEATWEAGWQRTFMSAVRLTRAFLPGMEAKGWGRVINVTSITARQPLPRLLLSNAYRAAVTGMARTLADEVAAKGITVNNIAPGYIATSRHIQLATDRATQSGRTLMEEDAILIKSIPAGRLGSPEEVGALACFLASRQASYITGTTILVDGGMHRGSA